MGPSPVEVKLAWKDVFVNHLQMCFLNVFLLVLGVSEERNRLMKLTLMFLIEEFSPHLPELFNFTACENRNFKIKPGLHHKILQKV